MGTIFCRRVGVKTQREVMIDSLVDLVDDWELDALIVGAKSYLKCRYKKMKTFEIEEEYMNFCAAQEYPETFPEGYNE